VIRGDKGRRTFGVLCIAGVALACVACTDDPDPAATETLPASGVTDAMATLEGTVSQPEDGTVSYWFEYGPTADYGSETPEQELDIDDRDAQPITEDLAALEPEATVHFRACAQGEAAVCGEDATFSTAAASTITADPALFPEFDPGVTDYVTRCGTEPVAMTVSAPEVTTVAVAEEPATSGDFTQAVPLAPGESFSFATTTSERTSTYHVRCLPGDFPDWTYTRDGDPSASFYITTPQSVSTPDGELASTYVAVFDDQGVPVWWTQADSASDAKLLPDGTLGWGITRPGAVGFNIVPGSFQTHELDGSVVHTWTTIDAPTDFHDFQLLEDGNALIGAYPARPGTTDLTAFGVSGTNGTLLDGVVQEVTPDGTVAWSWSTEDHIDLSETPERWRPTFVYGLPHALPDGREAFDWAHLNSIQQVDDTVLLSFRHLDAVYLINKADGEIIWKLGGTPTPKSLTVVGDPEENPLGGQHDARLLEDGTVTIYDNNSLETTAPRAVSYEIDLEAMTAMMVESVSDPDVPTSPCCGSATRFTDGSWAMSWGGTRVISEFGPEGDRHFALVFKEAKAFGFSYRVNVVQGDALSIDELRAGMDAMAQGG